MVCVSRHVTLGDNDSSKRENQLSKRAWLKHINGRSGCKQPKMDGIVSVYKGCVPVGFEVSYWMPSLGSGGPNPDFWNSFYLSEWEVEKRDIEVEKVRVTVNGIEKELARDEKVVVLVVPERYESWYNQAYELEMFDDIKMIYREKAMFP